MAQARTRSIPHYDGGLCAGHLLVWTWRKMVGGHGECPVLMREYDRFAGKRADALLAAFATFLLLLGRGSRRVLSVGPPYCPGLTTDEERMLRLIGTAQAGEGALAGAHLAWLVRRECQESVRQAVENLAASLTDAGVVLPPISSGARAAPMALTIERAEGWL